MGKLAIEVKEISKKYQIGGNVHNTLRETLSNLFKKSKKQDYWALKNVSFSLQKGDALGIVGDNGAGKSTLLKILSRITYPTSGKVTMNGRLSSLLEVGTGFHHELTGRENIYLNGSLLGMKKSEIRDRFDEIVDFSGIEKFIDTPVKHYSSGMYTRLAFSVAAHLNTEILLVDEVLAVGDNNFQKKCLGKMGSYAENGKTVVLVSHNHSHLEKICNQFIRLDQGQIIASGTKIGDVRAKVKNFSKSLETQNSILQALEFSSSDDGGLIQSGEDLFINVKTQPFSALNNQIVRLEVTDPYGGVKMILNNRLISKHLDLREGGEIQITIKALPLQPGMYFVNVLLKDLKSNLDKNLQPLPLEVSASKVQSTPAVSSQVFCNFSYDIIS